MLPELLEVGEHAVNLLEVHLVVGRFILGVVKDLLDFHDFHLGFYVVGVVDLLEQRVGEGGVAGHYAMGGREALLLGGGGAPR